MFEVSFSQASSRLNSFFLLVSALYVWSSGLCKLLIMWDLCWIFVCLFVFPLMGKAEWGGNPVCWWLGLYFCFVCCLDEASCTGCYWWLGDAGSCITVVSFVWVLTIWYPIGLVPEKAMAPHSSTLLLGKPHGQRSLVGCSPWGH